MIVKSVGRLSLLLAAAVIAAFSLATVASADPTVTVDVGSGDTTG